MKVLMVCLGNICRSPLAEGILRHKAAQNGLDILVDSAGTSGWHCGNEPDKRSVAIAKKYGIDITAQRGRQFGVNDFDNFDHIYVMDKSNLDDVLSLARNEADRNKVELILNKYMPGKNRSVPDPYYGGEQGFEDVYNVLDEACEVIVKEIKSELK